MGTDRYPDLPTRDGLVEFIAYDSQDATSDQVAAVVDLYTARVIAEHRDTEQGCCHCGIPGKHYTSDHKAEQPKRCPSVAPSAEAEQCALDAGHHSPIHRCDDTEWTG